MCSVKEIFASPKPIKRNFIQENVKQLREMEKYWQDKGGKEIQPHGPAKSKFPNTARLNVPSHITSDKWGSKANPSVDFVNRNSKSAQPMHKKSPTKQATSTDQNNAKTNRRAYTGDRGKRSVGDQLLKKNDIAKYIQTQCGNVFNQKDQCLRHSGSDLSLDLSSLESEKIIKCASTITHRSTGCQTIDPDELDNLYREGTIRIPSAHKQLPPKLKIANKKTIINTKIVNNPKREDNATSPISDKLLPSQNGQPVLDLSPVSEADKVKESNAGDTIDFVRLNAMAAASLVKPLAPAVNPLAAPSTYRKGVIPKYLQKRQEEWQKESDQKAQDAPDPACPPGHLPLADAERKDTLTMLRKSYGELVHELNMMPVRTDTLRMRQRKMELEKQLNKLEDGIKVFSRQKVFVKIGE